MWLNNQQTKYIFIFFQYFYRVSPNNCSICQDFGLFPCRKVLTLNRPGIAIFLPLSWQLNVKVCKYFAINEDNLWFILIDKRIMKFPNVYSRLGTLLIRTPNLRHSWKKGFSLAPLWTYDSHYKVVKLQLPILISESIQHVIQCKSCG